MKCPYCNNLETRVVDSRYVEELNAIRRRRECTFCGKRFTTYERIESSPLVVKKKDGRREPFMADKLRYGIELACRKRPISTQEINRMVQEIEMELRNLDSPEVESKLIGELVLKKLAAIDEVAYIRFASVYEEFEDIEGFKEALKRINRMKKKKKKEGEEDGAD